MTTLGESTTAQSEEHLPERDAGQHERDATPTTSAPGAPENAYGDTPAPNGQDHHTDPTVEMPDDLPAANEPRVAKSSIRESSSSDTPPAEVTAAPATTLLGTVPELSPAERHEVTRRTAISVLVVHEAIREEGERELRRSPRALMWSGLAAGLSMGFSLVGQGLLEAGLPATPWRTLVSSLGYSLGFLIVVLGRQQLFTENTLTVILPLLAHPNRATLFKVCKLWSTVLIANLLGAFIFATIIGHTALFPPGIDQAFRAIGLRALRGSFGVVVVRGIFAGWLIALMVWLLPSAESGRIHIIVILTYIVALGGFAHVIAGSVEVLYLVSVGGATWATFFGGFLAPTLIGNIIGGVSLVAVLNFAQVAVEDTSDENSGNEAL